VKRLRGKEIVLVKVIWVGPTGESATWESESHVRVLHPDLFSSSNFLGRKFFLVGESCNNPFLARIILYIYCMYLCVFICAYLSLYVFDLGSVDFWPRRVY